jgi:hypothetical protein
MTQVFNNLIRFSLIPNFVDYWNKTSIQNLIKDDYLNLRISRRDYSLVTEGAGVTTKQGYKSVYGNKEGKRLGFRIRVRSQSEDLYLALLELANYTAGEGCELQPIEVLDYIYLHDRNDRDRGYRIRRGVFEGEFSEVSGVVTQGYINCEGKENITGDRYSSGFSFKFMELEPAGYF